MAKSTGQWIGTVVGAIVGAFIPGGYVMLGAAIGGAIGGAIDPPKGPKIEGPRLNDLNVQTATLGVQIPTIKGTVATFGNIFWVENNKLKETKKTEEQGGKGGGGGAETTTYSYSATFALGLCLGPVDSIGKIWCSGKLIADFTDSSLPGIQATNVTGWGKTAFGSMITTLKVFNPEGTGNGEIHFYNGGPEQQPNARMQAALGVANTPAFRGLAYLVFEDFQLADFGNSLMGAQFKVEIIEASGTDQFSIKTRIQSGLFPDLDTTVGASICGPYNPRIENGIMRFDKERDSYSVTLEGTLLSIGTAPGIAPGSVGDVGEVFYIGTTSGGHAVYYNTTGPGTSGYLVVGGNTQFASYFSPDWEFQGACVGADGNLYVHRYSGGTVYFEKYDGQDLSVIWSTPTTVLDHAGSSIGYSYLPGITHALAVNEGSLLWRLSVAGLSIAFYVYTIFPDGSLALLNEFTSEGGSGWDGNTVCPAATAGLCAITHNKGGFYVYDATPIATVQTVLLSEIVSSLCLGSNMLTAGDIDVTALTQDVRGYRITATAAIRSALEPLQACWPFDAVQSGYQIKFIPRGGSSVATVAADDLGARGASDKEAVRLSVSREMDSQLARRVESTFIDAAREYDTGTGPGTERLNTDAVNILQIELPVVLTADEAAGIEQTLLYLYWLERNDLSFVLPPTYLNVEPADVITVNTEDATHVVRVTRIQYLPDGRLECSAKYNHSPIYTPVAVGEAGAAPTQVLSLNGPTQLALLDVPCMDSTIMDKPGLLAATTGVYSGWPGATLLRSDDSGQTWGSVQGFATPGAVMGYATGAIAAGATHIIDAANRLNVRLFSGSLASVTELQMLNGANHFAYGVHGRWEILAAKTVTAEADGTYTLQNLMRGRFGTEQYTGTHGATDFLVLLDSARVRFVAMNISSINLSRLWRAVTRGALLDSASDTAMVYSAVNLECLSPVYARGSADAITLDWSIDWMRRTRTPVEPFSGAVAPLGETSESYEVEVWSSGYSALKRTITGLASASATYTAAQQIADFTAVQQTLYLKIYQVSSVMGRGYPLIASLVSAPVADPWIAFRFFATRMQGANGSTTFTDLSTNAHAMTASGNAAITTSTFMVGDSSCAFDGTQDHITVGANNVFDWMHKGNESWTMVVRLRATVVDGTNSRTVWANFEGGAQRGVNFILGPNGLLYFIIGNQTAGYALNHSGGTGCIVQNQWHYVEFNYDHTAANGSRSMLFVDGVAKGSQAGGSNSYDTGAAQYTQPRIGRYPSTYDFSWIGQMQEMIIYRGVACHRANYSPPAVQFNL